MTVVATTSVVVAAVSAAVAAAVAAAAPVAGPLTAGARWGGACIIVSRGMEPAVGRGMITFDNCWRRHRLEYGVAGGYPSIHRPRSQRGKGGACIIVSRGVELAVGAGMIAFQNFWRRLQLESCAGTGRERALRKK